MASWKRTLGLMIAVAAIPWFLGGCPSSYGNATLRVVNDSPVPLVEVYVSRTTDDDWGENQLTSDIPGYGERDITDIPPGNYDLLAIDEDGGYAELYDVELDAGVVSEWTITDAKDGSGKDSEVQQKVDLGQSVEGDIYHESAPGLNPKN